MYYLHLALDKLLGVFTKDIIYPLAIYANPVYCYEASIIFSGLSLIKLYKLILYFRKQPMATLFMGGPYTRANLTNGSIIINIVCTLNYSTTLCVVRQRTHSGWYDMPAPRLYSVWICCESCNYAYMCVSRTNCFCPIQILFISFGDLDKSIDCKNTQKGFPLTFLIKQTLIIPYLCRYQIEVA